jgi:hypothetical protein
MFSAPIELAHQSYGRTDLLLAVILFIRHQTLSISFILQLSLYLNSHIPAMLAVSYSLSFSIILNNDIVTIDFAFAV